MNRSATLPTLAALVVALSSCVSPAPAGSPGAQPPAAPAPASRPGPEATAAAPAALYTEEQAERGRSTFRSSCSECHYSSEFRGTQFQYAWRERSVADLYRQISRNMPEDAPGSLGPQEYLDVVTYILRLNGFPSGGAELGVDEERMEAVLLRAPGEGGGARPDPSPTR